MRLVRNPWAGFRAGKLYTTFPSQHEAERALSERVVDSIAPEPPVSTDPTVLADHAGCNPWKCAARGTRAIGTGCVALSSWSRCTGGRT